MKNLFLVAVAAILAASLFSSCDTIEPNEPGALVPLTVDEDRSLPSIGVNGTRLHAETFGNPADPMIVVVHGGPGGDYRGLLNCRRFASDGFFVVFYDQRGSGLSRRHDKGIYTIQLMIDDLDSVISRYRQRPEQKVILMGHSWGAMLATAYVNEHPAAISGIVLMEPGGLTWPDAEEYIKRIQGLSVFDENSNDYVYLDQVLTGSEHRVLDYKAALQGVATYSAGNRLGNTGPVPFWRYGSVCHTAALEYAREHSFDFTTNLSRYTTKILFLYSELNEGYGRPWAEAVSSAYPNVELALIRGTGHEIAYFGWDQFYPVAKTYLDAIK